MGDMGDMGDRATGFTGQEAALCCTGLYSAVLGCTGLLIQVSRCKGVPCTSVDLRGQVGGVIRVSQSVSQLIFSSTNIY